MAQTQSLEGSRIIGVINSVPSYSDFRAWGRNREGLRPFPYSILSRVEWGRNGTEWDGIGKGDVK